MRLLATSTLACLVACAPATPAPRSAASSGVAGLGVATSAATAGPSPHPATPPAPRSSTPGSPSVRLVAGPPDEQVPLAAPGATPEPPTPRPAATPPVITALPAAQTAWVDALEAAYPAAHAPLSTIDLNREGTAPVTAARGFNVPDSHAPTGFVWNDSDRESDAWMPQGIGGFERDGRRWLVVAWYAKDEVEDTDQPAKALSYRGARLTLADVSDPVHVRYRHALLVQDAANVGVKALFRMRAPAQAGYQQGGRFAPVPIHAGGVEVYDHWLYVADTQLGLRVFDLDRMLRAEADPDKARCGEAQGRLFAFDYRYVVPQVAYYTVRGAAPYSCLALERPAMTLWLGQYLAPEDAPRSALTGLALGPDGRVGPQATAQLYPRDRDGGYAHRIQGAFRRGDQTWLAVTGQSPYEGSTARLVAYRDGAPTGFRWRWPHGAEDLYYDDAQDVLWCLTEHPKSLWSTHDRLVFGVALGTYQAP